MSGGSLSTKGLVSGGGGSLVELPALANAPAQAPLDTGVPTNSIVIIAPTAPNVCLMATENIVQNLLARQASNLTLPSLYKRAYMIAYETDELAVVKQ